MMKNIFKLFGLLAISINCNAQNQIIDIQDNNGDEITGAYYKDVQNILNPFVGTYIYTNGTTSLTIVLQKKLMSSMNDYYYEDLIIGGYQFIKDGVEITNTLNRLNATNITNGRAFISIHGNMIITKGSPPCQHCTAGEKALRVGLVEDATGNWASTTIRKIIQNGQAAIEVFVFWEGPKAWPQGTPRPLDASFPGGYYILIKQP